MASASSEWAWYRMHMKMLPAGVSSSLTVHLWLMKYHAAQALTARCSTGSPMQTGT